MAQVVLEWYNEYPGRLDPTVKKMLQDEADGLGSGASSDEEHITGLFQQYLDIFDAHLDRVLTGVGYDKARLEADIAA